MTSNAELIKLISQIKAKIQELDSKVISYSNGEDIQDARSKLQSVFADDPIAAQIISILTNVTGVLGNAESALTGASYAADKSIESLKR